MRLFFLVLILFILNIGYSNNDSLKVDTCNQLSFLPDSNNYNLFVGGPSSIFKSILFDNKKLSIFSDHPFHSLEQVDLPNLNFSVPVVDVQYILGPQLEQNLVIFHSQPINKNSNYAISYLKRSHDGYYSNQSTNSNYMQAYYQLKSKSEKYKMHTGIKHHRIYNRQNGGISNDTNFTNSNDLFLNRLLMDVNMMNSFSNDKLFKVFSNHSYLINENSDSLINHKSSILFSANYTRKFRNYYDSLSSDYFLYNYYDSISSNDTLQKDIWQSSLYFSRDFSSDSNFKNFLFGWNSELVNHSNLNLDTLINNHHLETKLNLKSKKKSILLKAKFFPLGYKKNNYEFDFKFSKNISNLINLKADFKLNKLRPVFEFQNFSSNHLQWNHLFSSMNLLSTSGQLNIGSLSLNLNYTEINNPVYFNELNEAEQFKGYSQIIKTSLNHEIKRNRLYLFSELIHQFQAGGQIFQLPELIGQLKFNYTIVHEKSNLKLNLGINATYYSSFYLMNYSPTINQFSVSKERKQDQYLTIDFIAKTQIKNVTIFAMISHLNSGLTGYNYFTALNYPSPDRYLKFGLKWLFLN